MDRLRQALEAYQPDCGQELRDRELMLSALSAPHALTRENPVEHFTASAWVIDRTGEQVLMLWHNIYRSWSWAGGHADGEEDLLAVALREVQEETGLTARPVSREIYSLEILPVEGHVKRQAYVAPHLHLNITYLLQADERLPLRKKPDENSAVSWMRREEAIRESSEPYMRRIYTKLNAKLARFLPLL